jgi:hypothetical protein
VGRVRKTLHQVKGLAGPQTVRLHVLDDHALPGNALRLAQQLQRLRCMVEDIDEQDEVDALVGHAEVCPIEKLYGHMRVGSCKYLDGAEPEIRAALEELARKQAVACANIDDGCTRW